MTSRPAPRRACNAARAARRHLAAEWTKVFNPRSTAVPIGSTKRRAFADWLARKYPAYVKSSARLPPAAPKPMVEKRVAKSAARAGAVRKGCGQLSTSSAAVPIIVAGAQAVDSARRACRVDTEA